MAKLETASRAFGHFSFLQADDRKSQNDVDLYVMINAYAEPLRFTIFDGVHKPWFRVVDTGLASPHDICAPGGEAQIIGSTYLVQARSIVVLIQ